MCVCVCASAIDSTVGHPASVHKRNATAASKNIIYTTCIPCFIV